MANRDTMKEKNNLKLCCENSLQKNKIMTVEELAENIKSKMATKNLTAYKIIKNGVHKTKVYSVLQMGQRPNKNYTVATLLEVLDAAGLELYEVAV